MKRGEACLFVKNEDFLRGNNMRLILIGSPGSGKGTVAASLQDKFKVAHISTGDMFRAHISDQTELGQAVRDYLEIGQLVPDDITINMVKERLSQPDCKRGFMLDGFPRTITQAQALDAILEEQNLPIEAVINLVVPDELVIKRISNRRICSSCGESFSISFNPSKVEGICDECSGNLIQREDDRPETVLDRLETFRHFTRPLLDYYRDRAIVFDIDNSNNSENAIRSILSVFNKLDLS